MMLRRIPSKQIELCSGGNRPSKARYTFQAILISFNKFRLRSRKEVGCVLSGHGGSPKILQSKRIDPDRSNTHRSAVMYYVRGQEQSAAIIL